ncbi:GrpB family protein [Guptibacillus algicola]|uniref:GrpB family protein n=1 Tax=Guptibacillus algicola TaxID=225844 RepID=UPI001CD693E5|nr:GrpB family protein [Alkalihalobacillus algicola]MCA0986517.1 GrpB family protein [Alkalihalobacillus algicola]
MRKVVVEKFDNNWKLEFEKEKRIVRSILGKNVMEIYHIGSTAVEGLSAKPIIDMMPVVQDIHHVDRCNEEMTTSGYEPKGENGIPGRRYFQKGGDERSHHVHVYEKGSAEIKRHLAFRDYLRCHPVARMKYSNIKEELALKFPDDIASYIKGKDEFVRNLEMEALDWYRSK